VFGSIGGPEVILLFVVALLLFGPRRLPEIGRTLGKALAEFRRATSEFKMNLEREVQIEEIKSSVRPIENAPRPQAVARGLVMDAVTAALPAPQPAPDSVAEPEALAPPKDTPAIDGGPGSIH
jgi:Tat protein translocase TatB subunit